MNNKIIIALDFDNYDTAIRFVDLFLDPTKHAVKIGTNILFSGGNILHTLKLRKYEIMLDCKFFDTPDTVYRYCKQAASVRVDMITVHSMGLCDMLHAAVEGAHSMGKSPLVIAVTILTSMDEVYLRYNLNIQETVDDCLIQNSLEHLAQETGCDGVVLHGTKLKEYKKEYSNMKTIVPGIRGTDDDNNCQNVVVTPQYALQNNADYIVVGRHVTASDDPRRRLLELEWAIEQYS